MALAKRRGAYFSSHQTNQYALRTLLPWKIAIAKINRGTSRGKPAAPKKFA